MTADSLGTRENGHEQNSPPTSYGLLHANPISGSGNDIFSLFSESRSSETSSFPSLHPFDSCFFFSIYCEACLLLRPRLFHLFSGVVTRRTSPPPLFLSYHFRFLSFGFECAPRLSHGVSVYRVGKDVGMEEINRKRNYMGSALCRAGKGMTRGGRLRSSRKPEHCARQETKQTNQKCPASFFSFVVCRAF